MATEYVTHRDLDAFRAELRGEFAKLRGELAATEGRLRQEMGALTRTIVFANLGAVIGVGGLVLAAAGLS